MEQQTVVREIEARAKASRISIAELCRRAGISPDTFFKWRKTPRNPDPVGAKLRLLVSFIMLVVVELWIIESRPGWLFAFVVAIGLGFSGFSLLELFGEQVRDFVRRAFAGAANTIKGPDGP